MYPASSPRANQFLATDPLDPLAPPETSDPTPVDATPSVHPNADALERLLNMLGIDLDETQTRELLAQHGDALEETFFGSNAPLTWQVERAMNPEFDRVHLGRAYWTSSTSAPQILPDGFGELMLALADEAPGQCQAMVKLARKCRPDSVTDRLMDQAYDTAKRAIARSRAAEAATTTTTTTTTQTTGTTQTAGNETTTTMGQTVLPPDLSYQAQNVLETNRLGGEKLGDAIDLRNLTRVRSILARAPYLLNTPLADGRTPLLRAVRAGDIDIVNLLLLSRRDSILRKEGSPVVDVDTADSNGTTPLHEAASAGYTPIVSALLKAGAKPNPVTRKEHNTPLHCALSVKSGRCAEELVSQGADVHARRSDGATPFYLAMENDLLGSAKLLQSRGADIHLPLKNGRTPLMVACRRGTETSVAWLLQQGADPSRKGDHGMNVLHMTAKNRGLPLPTLQILRQAMGDEAYLKMAVEGDRWGTTAASMAAQHGHFQDVVDALRPAAPVIPIALVPPTFKRGWVVIGQHDRDWGMGAMLKDATRAHIEMHNYGNGTQDLTWAEYSALDFKSGDFLIVHCHARVSGDLGQVMLNFGKNEKVPLTAVVREGYNKGVSDFLVLGCKVSVAIAALRTMFEKDPAIRPPADAALGFSGLRITTVGRDRNTLSVLNKHTETLYLEDCVTHRKTSVRGNAMDRLSVQDMSTLVGSKAGVSVVHRVAPRPDDLAKMTPAEANRAATSLLLMHVFDNDTSGMNMLLGSRKVDPRINVLGEGSSILAAAATQDHAEALEILLPLIDGDVNWKQRDGNSLLHLASGAGKLAVVRLLLDRDAVIDIPGKGGSTPLWQACMKGQLQAARLLLARGANLRVTNDEGYSMLHVAAASGRLDLLELLTGLGMDVNLTNPSGLDPLILACSFGHVRSAQFLLEHGAAVHRQTDAGVTALHAASMAGSLEAVELLLKAGAPRDGKTVDGLTPADIARNQGHIKVAERLALSH